MRVPVHYQRMLIEAVTLEGDEDRSARLLNFAWPIYSRAWDRFVQDRFVHPEDNHPAHELVVLAAGRRIRAEMDESCQRIGIIVDLLHDASPMNRAGVTEADIMKAPEKKRPATYAERTRRRVAHMDEGARIAADVMSTLRDQFGGQFVTLEEIDGACRLISKHDLIKVDNTPYTDVSDELAVACYEADQLFLIHPFGLVGDMDRGPSSRRGAFCAQHWSAQLAHNVAQFTKWKEILQKHSNAGQFQGDTLFRTIVGYKIFNEWLSFWSHCPG